MLIQTEANTKYGCGFEMHHIKVKTSNVNIKGYERVKWINECQSIEAAVVVASVRAVAIQFLLHYHIPYTAKWAEALTSLHNAVANVVKRGHLLCGP